MIVFHAADLLWASKIKGTADALGLAARPVRTLEMLEARLGDSPVTALIVDLDAPDVAMALIERVRRIVQVEPPLAGRASGPPSSETAARSKIRVVAFGPHVAVEHLRAAKRAGADTVLTRGAFHTRLPELLKALSSPFAEADAGAVGAATLQDQMED